MTAEERAFRKELYKLDGIGFIGTQRRSKAQIKRDSELTRQYIEDLKARKIIRLPKRDRELNSPSIKPEKIGKIIRLPKR